MLHFRHAWCLFMTELVLFPPYLVAEYLQAVSVKGGLKHLNITCTFASSIDITIKCSIELKGPTAMTFTIDKPAASPTAEKMVNLEVILIY